MDENELLLKIAEIRSYIASDWPSVEERKRLYKALAELEGKFKNREEVRGPDEPR